MASVIQRIHNRKLASMPSWLPTNLQYECVMGSVAYGVSSDNSDMDVYGFCIPRKETVFPHLQGYIPGFGTKPQGFDQYQQHHIDDVEAKKNYDVCIYSIVKYFHLCMDNNPNMIDSLFVPFNCVLHSTKVGTMIRDNRKLFLHKGCYHRFRGYAFQQLHKAKTKNPQKGSRRYEDVEKHGFDAKFCYHVVRLLDECEQILTHQDLDLQRSRGYLKAIRRGEVSFEEVEKYFSVKEKNLENLYHSSKLRYSPDEGRIKQLLLDCLEEHYGSMDDAVVNPDQAVIALREINEIIKKNNELL